MIQCNGGTRRFRVAMLVVCLVVTLALPGVSTAATSPGSVPTTLAHKARMPGDHQAQLAYFASIRQAPKGTSPGQARAAALQRARALPALRALPATNQAGAGAASGPGRQGYVAPIGSWEQLGPAPEDSDALNPNNDYQFGIVSGRATAVVVGPHTGVIYLGTADGGVWKSTNDGITWVPLTDAQPSLAVGALALDPNDATDRTLYVGTGESSYDIPPAPVFNGDAYFGVGVLKTTDGGGSWVLQGQSVFGGGTYSANSVGFDVLVTSGTTVFAGTTKGLFRSTNGGTNWSQITVAAGSSTARVTDLAVDPSNPQNVYAVLSEASPNFSYAGVYKSTNGGATFVSITTAPLPASGTWGRTRLAIAPSAPQTLYLVINDGTNLVGMYKTVNGGATWLPTITQPPNYFDGGGGGQGFYDDVLIVDPANANHVYAGGVYFVASTDGGLTWATIANVYCSGTFPCHGPIHPDQHGAFVTASGALYVANDGGIWKSTNPTAGAGTTWADLNANLATIQYYAGDVAANYLVNPIVAAGAQDNGTSRTGSAALGKWNGILGGDGGYVAIDKTNPGTIYAEYQNGAVQKTTNAGAGTSIAWIDITPSCNKSLFIAPFVLDPNHGNHLAFGGGSEVCESTNGGTTWYQSNSNIVLNDYIQSVAIAPSNGAVIYAGTQSGGVFRTTSANTGSGTNWTNISTGLPTAPVTAIAINRSDPNMAYITFGNFGVSHVWKTTNGGGSWANITGNLPDIPTTTIVTYPTNLNPVLIVGTDIGVYVSTDNGSTWSSLGNSLPNVGIQQLFTDKAITTVFAATHGRGMWRIGIPSATLSSIAVTPAAPTIPRGTTQQFTATGTFSDGSTADLTSSVSWASSDTTKATIANTSGNYGLATGVAIGTTTITAQSGSITSPGMILTVTDNPAVSLSITGLPASPAAGASQTLTVTALDAATHTATGYTGTVHFTSTDTGATLPMDYPFQASDHGTRAFSVAFHTPGSQTITAKDTAMMSITGSQSVTVVPAAGASLSVTGFPSQATAGTSNSLIVEVRDASGNIATGYTGTVHFTSTDPLATSGSGLPSDYAFTAGDQGVHVFTATLKTAGARNITLTDTPHNLTGSQNGITVIAAPATHFTLTAPTSASAGSSFALAVTAKDAYNNIATGYRGTVRVTTSDLLNLTAATYTFASGDNGAHTLNLSLLTAGAQTISVTDATDNTLSGNTGITITGAGITGFTPLFGPTAGQTTVTITGAGLSGASVTFGGVAATNVVVDGAGTSLTCVTPAHAAQTVDVVLTTASGSVTIGHAFTYLPPGGVPPIPGGRSSGASSGSGFPPAAAPPGR